ncbi:hypothetical protein B0H17DRAFT_1151559 [Mycena rosella]|uniref:Uncharacterized protein n=1 Tax=Mycena rosella TaxID=1033263 RepID=A0AAD7BJQ5_MYCRO|nr:hypothetical protein B0H17DRAFT_1151559 [Mycena rosella]
MPEIGGQGYGNRLEQTGVVETRCWHGKPGLMPGYNELENPPASQPVSAHPDHFRGESNQLLSQTNGSEVTLCDAYAVIVLGTSKEICEDNVPQPRGHEHAWVDTGSEFRTGLTEQKFQFDRLSARLNEREGRSESWAYRLSETVEVEVELCSKSGEQSPPHAHPKSDGPVSTRLECRCASDTLPNQI